MAKTRLRCAIYTRKSSEEGLEQDFNSLHAQREAGEAYVASQAHEGWRAIKTRFDDGGRSGGSLERPALQALLTEIDAGRVDVVVIYKIDRLTRSLTDFAQLAKLFEHAGVSFVSITQQFNSTTSMGRLMLNVLLSFAQFEREITGERIRDKIAASKKKGMWMGGFVPLGYDTIDRKLVVNEREAESVRRLFSLYLKYKNVRKVREETLALNLLTKQRTDSSGDTRGSRPFSRGHIYRILRNPIYAGWIAHCGKLHEGAHQELIERGTWNQVQDLLQTNARNTKRRATAAVPGLLVGLLFSTGGQRLTHAHSTKGDRRYRYYVSRQPDNETDSGMQRPTRIPAAQIEKRVKQALAKFLMSPAALLDAIDDHSLSPAKIERITTGARKLAAEIVRLSPGDCAELLQSRLHRVTIDPNQLRLSIKLQTLLTEWIPGYEAPPQVEAYELRVPASYISQSGQMKIIIDPTDELEGGIDERLVKAVARAYGWFEQLKAGDVTSIREIAERESLSASYVMRYIKLAFLAPDIVEAILAGRQPPGVSVRSLTNGKQLPSCWAQQRQLLGLPAI